MQVAKGLESIHRWKKQLKLNKREIASIEKRLEAAKEGSPSWEVEMVERKLAEAQEALSLTEKALTESWE